MSGPNGVPVSRAAYALLGAMSLISFAGPFGLALLLSGGERRGWPPDRPVEWAGAIGLFAAFAACLLACLTVRLWLVRPAPPGPAAGEGEDDDEAGPPPHP